MLEAEKTRTASDYTEDSWKVYEAAYNKLNDAVESAVSATTLLRYMELFTSAKNALVKKETDPTPGGTTPGGTTPGGTTPGGTTPGGTIPGGSNAGDTTPKPTPENPAPATLTQGKTYQTADGLKYKVTSASKKTVSLVGTSNKKKLTKLTVKASVTIEGVKCKVTAIGAKAFSSCKKLTKVTVGANVTNIGKQAFSGCAKLKTITVKSKLLKKVGAKAFKGINKKAVIKVPKAKKAKYTKLFAKKGQAATVKVK